MRIQWTDKARGDLDKIVEYISEDNPTAAFETILKIINTVDSTLSQHPGIGRPGRYADTRELIIAGTPYIVPYLVTVKHIYILRVLHGAMQWPDKF